MNCEEISKILNQQKSSGVPDNLTSLLTVLYAFQCQGIVAAHTEREQIIFQAHGEVEKMQDAGVEPHPDIIRVLNHLSR